MLVDVSPRLRVRHGIPLDTGDGLVKPHARREAAIVLCGLRPARAVIGRMHPLRLVRSSEGPEDLVRKPVPEPSAAVPAADDDADTEIEGQVDPVR